MPETVKRLLRCGAMVLISMLLLLTAGRYAGRSGEISLQGRISNYDAVIESIRHGLRGHSRCITVRFRYPGDVMEELSGMVGDWMEETLAETGDPTGGDYIRYQYGGYEITCSTEPAGAEQLYTVEIYPKYYMYLFQEEAVTAQLAEVYRDFGFDEDTTDYEKVRAIYDFVCETVRYDYIRKKNAHQHLKSTAYAALIQRTATCQGYCTLLYRMLRENGVGCRIVTGTAYGENLEEFHAWNLVELDGQYYCLDATWDSGRTEYRYFLRGAAEFTDHVPDPAFLTEGFTAQYPVSETDYSESKKIS